MHRMESDFVPALMAAATGKLAGHKLRGSRSPSVCVVLASGGYPGAYETGKEIIGIKWRKRWARTVFHAGTRMAQAGWRPPEDGCWE